MNLFKSLRSRLIITFLGVALISVVSVAIVTYQLARSTITQQAGGTLHTLAQSQSVTVGNEITNQINLMATMVNSRSFRDAINTANAGYQGDTSTINAQIEQLDQVWRIAHAANNNADSLVRSVLFHELAPELAKFQKNFPDHIEVFVTDRYGANVASTGRTSDYNQADEDWWQSAYNNTRGAIYIGQPQYDESSKSFAINLAVPVQNEETGAVIGILRSTYSMQAFSHILASVRFGETGEADLIFASGDVIGSKTRSAIVDPVILSQLQDNIDGYGVLVYRDRLRVVSQAKVVSAGSGADPISNLNWYLVAYQDAAEILQPVETQTRNTVYVSIGVFLVATILAIFAARSLSNPIVRLTAVTDQFAAGDLTVHARVESQDEIGKLADTFNHMTGRLRQYITNEQAQRKYLEETISQYADFTGQVMQGKLKVRLPVNDNGQDHANPLVKLGKSLNEMTANLHQMIAQTREAANNLGSAATEILAATTQQASGAAEQSAAIAQTTATANQVKVISRQSSSRLNEVASTSHHTVEVTRSGQKSVQQMIESMAQIKERVEAIAENTLALSEQTQQIGEIIATVNEIATQSNILALNASVEAARAGEHGKGFAVVAMEVRNLAEQSKQATAQIGLILSKIQNATNLTVMATEGGAKGVDNGVQLAAQARESIEQLSKAVNEATLVATQVATGGQQLQTGIDQMAVAVQQISQVTVQSLASTRQTEKSAQNLNELARRLNEDISRYEL